MKDNLPLGSMSYCLFNYLVYSKKKKLITHVLVFVGLAPVVRKANSAVHWVNNCPLDSAIGFPNTYPMDSAINLLNNRSLLDKTNCFLKLIDLCVNLVTGT